MNSQKVSKFKIAYEACQGLPHRHNHSLFTHHTLLKIYRQNKLPGQYFEILLPPFVWEEDRNFKIQLLIVSVCQLSALCCPEDGSGLKITILNLLEVSAEGGGGQGDSLIKAGTDVRRVQNLDWAKLPQKT